MKINNEKEPQRLQKLISLGILDTPFEKSFDQVTDIVSRTLDVPIALVSLVDKERQWFKSCVGLAVRETPRDISFCTHAIEQDDIFVVNDATQDPRFKENPLCTGEPFIRFYAGMPLKTKDGFNVGTLCIIDQKPRNLSEKDQQLLKVLAEHVVALMEHRQVSRDLSKLAQQFLEIQKISHTGVWSADLNTGEINWSDEIYNIHGISTGKKITLELLMDFYLHKDQERLRKVILHTFETAEPFDITLELSDSNSTHKLVRCIATPIIENNKVVGLKGTFQDITEKTQLDLEVKSFFNLSENLLGIANDKGYFIKINPAWKLLGYSEHEILSSPFMDLVHPDDKAATEKAFENLFAGDHVVGFENRYRKKDGHYISLQWFSSRDSKTGLVFAVAADVTKRKAQEAIAEAIGEVRSKFVELAHDKKTFFDYLLKKILSLTESEYGFVGEIIEDDKGRFLKTYALTDISWDEESRKFVQENIAQGIEFRNLNSLFGEVIKTERTYISNHPASDPNRGGLPSGHPELKCFLGIPIHYANKFIGMIGVANRQNGFSQAMVNELEPFFESIGSFIFSMQQEEELEKQQRMLIHHSKLASLGNIAAGIGHEINNPLAILVGQLDLIRRNLEDLGQLSSTVESRIQKAEKAALRIENIVKGLRQLARGDQSDFSQFDLSEMVHETCLFASEMMNKEEIKINIELEPHLLMFGNRGRIQQVLVNLLNNAKDALRDIQREKIIQVHLSSKDHFVYLSVSDNGSGIPAAIKDKIFDPFFTTKKVHEGTGIGLSLSSSIVKEHNGIMSVESKMGTGSTFKIKLPLNIDENKSVSHANDTHQFSGKVLIVDDEEDIRLFLKQMLEDIGLDVEVAVNGKNALDIYQSRSGFDIIISDIRMPLLNGIELLDRLRSSGYSGHFFFITGGDHSSLDSRPQSYQGIIDKPFTPQLVMQRLTPFLTSTQRQHRKT